MLAAALTACHASLVYAVPWYVTAAILIALLGLRHHERREATRTTTLSRAGDSWSLSDDDSHPPVGGLVLVHGGYRSAWLVVLRFRGRDGRRRDVEVWRDAVSAEDFSRLALAHRFEASDDVRDTAAARGRVSSHPTAIRK